MIMTLDLVNITHILLSNLTTNTSSPISLIPDDKDRLTQPIHTAQQEIDAIRSKSGATQVDVDKESGAKSITFSILLMIIAMFFSSI